MTLNRLFTQTILGKISYLPIYKRVQRNYVVTGREKEMSIIGVNSALVDAYRYTGRAQKIAAKRQAFAEMMEEMKNESGNISDKEETESSADIVVKPDGSRVLVLTTSVGGRKTTMSIEISKPTDGQYAPQLIKDSHFSNFYGESLDNMGSGN